MTDEERLQQHLNLMRGDPLIRLTGDAAYDQAYKLRMTGLSYRAVALVMGLYHGQWYDERKWRLDCNRRGVPRRRGKFAGRPKPVQP